MKRLRIVTLILAITMAAPTLLNAQIIKGEAFLGGNASQVDGDECYGYKRFGIHAGAGALIPVTSFMDVGLEVLFNQRGAFKRDSITYNSTFPYAYNLRLNYAEVPLMIYLTDKGNYSVGLGVSYGRVVGLSEKNDGIPTGIGLGDGKLTWKDSRYKDIDLSDISSLEQLSEVVYGTANLPDTISITEVIDNSNTYRKDDITFLASLRVRVYEGFHAELRYQYSIRPIRTRLFYQNNVMTLPAEVRLQYNNSLTLRLVYIFNEHRSASNKEASKKSKTM